MKTSNAQPAGEAKKLFLFLPFKNENEKKKKKSEKN